MQKCEIFSPVTSIYGEQMIWELVCEQNNMSWSALPLDCAE